MQVHGHRLPAVYAPALDRAREVAPQALRLVERAMREQAGHVEVAVTDAAGARELLRSTHRALLGTRNKERGRRGDALAHTTPSTRGVLIVVDAEGHDGDLELLDETLVHEMAHAVQFNRPGVRETVLLHLRNNYRLIDLSRAECRAADKQGGADEAEAEAMERLARKLSKVVV